MTRERSAEEVAGAARRMVRALGRRVGREDPVDLVLIAQLRAEVEAAYDAALLGQKGMGYSDAEIASAVGVTRQAITKRLSRLPNSDDASGDVA